MQTLTAAAQALGTTGAALRQRIRRGTLAGEKVNGVWYVNMDVPTQNEGLTEPSSQLCEALQAHIRDLQAQLQVKDAQLAAVVAGAEVAQRTLLAWSMSLTPLLDKPSPWWKKFRRV